MKTKKYLVLGILFILPLSMYIFFASGKDNFGRLPILTEGVAEISNFKTAEGAPVTLQNHITVLGFLGEDPLSNKANAFNLTHKIYKKNQAFEDFQFVILLPNGAEAESTELKNKIGEIVDPNRWIFAFGTPEAIDRVFKSMRTDYLLASDSSSPYVFIIDKERRLRGRDDDEDVGVLHGFDARNYSEINNKMNDDVKVILAEYRLALKKYKSEREI